VEELPKSATGKILKRAIPENIFEPSSERP